jgi:DNA-binding MarR family transcriptional regulator
MLPGMDLGGRVGAALGELLQRGSRAHLYRDLTAGLSDGLTATTYPVISGVARLAPVTATDLAVQIGLDRTVASRYASQLESHGLLRRRPDTTDPRKSLLSLTAKGERAVTVMRHRLAATFETQLATWPPDQARCFVEGLERFVSEQRLLSHPPA